MRDENLRLLLEKNKVIDEALKEHYRETMECKRVPSDYLSMFTEGGEANAVAYAVEKATRERIIKKIEELDKQVGGYITPEEADKIPQEACMIIPWEAFKVLKNEK